MKDLEFIKKFSKITIKGACDEAGVNRSTLLNGCASADKEREVRDVLEKKFFNLYMEKREVNIDG